jgi:tetratricopeptide (TPR) repeat protein
MDRSAFAVCAVCLLPLIVLPITGCDTTLSSATSAPGHSPPAVLAELQSGSPGPWRHLPGVPRVATTALHEPTDPNPTAAQPADPTVAAPDASVELPNPAIERLVPEDAAARRDMFGPPKRSDAPALDAEEDPPIPSESSPSELPSEAGEEEPQGNDGARAVAPEIVERTLLPWAHVGPRTAEMTAVARRASERVRHGFQLAERGALFSARAEFVVALRWIAQASDAQQSTQFYGKALTAGLVALKESNDFIRRDANQAEADVSQIVNAHRTPILKTVLVGSYTSTMAAARYDAYAQEQLAAAAAQETAGSMALFGLGKVAAALQRNQDSQPFESTAHAMLLFQAALMVDARNYRASNELAVLSAENGNLSRARALLIHSVSLSPQVAAWHNLAVVHARLGEQQLAAQARARAIGLAQMGRGSGSAVQWVDPTTFAGLAPASEGLLPPANSARSGQAASPAAKPAASVAKKDITDWLPWSSRR